MPWGVAAVVGGVAIGAIGSASAASTAADGQVAAAQAANSPWSVAQPYISGQYDTAQDALKNSLAMGTNSAYDGERVAALNAMQTGAANNAYGWASGNGANGANALYGAGSSLLGAGQQYMNNAQGLYGAANSNQTQNILANAAQYANNPQINGMIDAASRDVNRNLNENQLTSLAMNAAGTGNTDSTRTGVQSAILQRGAQDRVADISSQIRGQAYTQGLNMAQSQYNAQQQQALAANGQLSTAYGQGVDSLSNANTMAANNYALGTQAGALYQNQQQNVDNANMSQFTERQNNSLNLLGQYMNVINGKYGGNGTTGTVANTVGAGIQGALGGASSIYGLYGKLSGNGGNGGGGSSSGGYGFTNPTYGAGSGTGYDTGDLSGYYNGSGNTYGFFS